MSNRKLTALAAAQPRALRDLGRGRPRQHGRSAPRRLRGDCGADRRHSARRRPLRLAARRRGALRPGPLRDRPLLVPRHPLELRRRPPLQRRPGRRLGLRGGARLRAALLPDRPPGGPRRPGWSSPAAPLLSASLPADAPLHDQYPLPTPFTACTAECPPNSFFLGSEPGFIADVIKPLREVLTIVALPRAVVVLSARCGRRPQPAADPGAGARRRGPALRRRQRLRRPAPRGRRRRRPRRRRRWWRC